MKEKGTKHSGLVVSGFASHFWGSGFICFVYTELTYYHISCTLGSSSRYSSFLPQSKDVSGRLIGFSVVCAIVSCNELASYLQAPGSPWIGSRFPMTLCRIGWIYISILSSLAPYFICDHDHSVSECFLHIVLIVLSCGRHLSAIIRSVAALLTVF